MDQDKLSPMPLRETTLVFTYTMVSGFVMFYWFRPYLEAQGFSEMRAYLIAVNLVLMTMFAWALVAFRIETGGFEIHKLLKRFLRASLLSGDWQATSAIRISRAKLRISI